MMAFESTIDSRPKVMGPLVLLTGTFTNDTLDTGGDIDLSAMCSKIFAAGANGNAAGATDTEIDGTAVNKLTLVTTPNLDGTWWALVQR